MPRDDLDLDVSENRAQPNYNRQSNEDAIRLWLIDQTLQHIMRQQGILGLGANVVQQDLRVERQEIVLRLQDRASVVADPAERRRA